MANYQITFRLSLVQRRDDNSTQLKTNGCNSVTVWTYAVLQAAVNYRHACKQVFMLNRQKEMFSNAFNTFLFRFGWRCFTKYTPDRSQAAKDALEEPAVTAAGPRTTRSCCSASSKRHINTTVELTARLKSYSGSGRRWGLEGWRTWQTWQSN